MKLIIALTIIAAFLTAGTIGVVAGMWLALPSQCFTADNLTQWTAECKAAKANRGRS